MVEAKIVKISHSINKFSQDIFLTIKLVISDEVGV